VRTSRNTAILALGLALSGCAPVVERLPIALPNQPEGFPSEVYDRATEQGQPVYRLDESRSLAVVRVYRGGRFADLGHDHVVASHEVRGLVRWTSDWRARRADLFVPLASLTVDEPLLRQRYALTTQPSARDIEGTRENMLNKTLRVADNPFVTLHLEALSGALPAMPVRAEISLNGVTNTRQREVTVEQRRNELSVSGAFSLKQTEFGLEPYTVLGGLLQVEDEVDITFELVARPL